MRTAWTNGFTCYPRYVGGRNKKGNQEGNKHKPDTNIQISAWSGSQTRDHHRFRYTRPYTRIVSKVCFTIIS